MSFGVIQNHRPSKNKVVEVISAETVHVMPPDPALWGTGVMGRRAEDEGWEGALEPHGEWAFNFARGFGLHSVGK